ncbi:hypothetical protein PR202_gb17128 [Eleusine coracana subsp. coracana]|uniref:Proteasome activator subunit 4 n=1 Tax=Eleusine coracana subsp. coracana TaxID=191504 RepID=A0AAV5F3P7_ELECO|nr:hypothetical protein PR202_gb17128 [Eleusine coracana subsp. coracana]
MSQRQRKTNRVINPDSRWRRQLPATAALTPGSKKSPDNGEKGSGGGEKISDGGEKGSGGDEKISGGGEKSSSGGEFEQLVPKRRNGGDEELRALVPISGGNGSYPFPVEVPRNTRFLFSSKTRTPSKAIAKSIVYLLRPKSLALEYFEKLINFLEQFYHPSNGGRWTYSLERFLRYLVVYFEKRLQHEQFESVNEKHDQFYLGKEERAAFVKAILKLLDRGQYSKNDSLAETVSIATSILSYVEPALVLPFVATNFQLALETTTATHQLKSAVTSVAFSGRALLLCSLSSSQFDDSSVVDSFSDLIVASLSNALLGMDANDPPKTIATMQLIGSIFSNLATVGGTDDVPAFLQATTLSNWLDEFFSRLFSVLQNLESSSPINEGYQTSFMSGTFLVEDSPYYFCMLEILLGKLSKPLFIQSLKRIAKFVNANILPGATSEVGLLCCACVHSNPEAASVNLLKPILMTIMSSFEGTPTTGYIGRVAPDKTYKKAALSPALETALDYYLRVLALAISYAGPVLLKYREELMHIITSAFQAPSWKVNGAGDHLLRSLLGNLVSYYPIDQYKPFNCQPISKIIEPWGCSKAHQDRESEMLNFPAKWHEPRDEKEHLKVTLLRINSALHGVMSCLPEIRPSYKYGSSNQVEPMFFIAGSAGSTVGSSEMREKAAEFVHIACRYLLKERADDSILLALVVRVIDALINYGSLEYDEWSGHVQAWNLESAAIIEPPCNFIIPFHAQGKKRYRTNADVCPSELMVNLMTDLLDLSLHNYETVRLYAGRSLTKMLKRWPSLISNCVLILTENFRNPKAPEHAVLGSCSILSSLTVLRHLTTDPVSLSSFIMGILARYNLMANRVLLLLILASRSESIYSQILAETAGHFLRNLKSQLPHSRMLAISALNTLLQGSPHKISSQDSQQSLDHHEECNISLTGQILNEIIQQDGFMTETLNSLSHVHITSDNDNSSKGSYGASSFQSGSDKAITYFYFDFSASWPRTPSWISLVGGDTFYSSFARIFKRLIQQCGMPVMSSLQTALEEFVNSKERSRQCVAAEAMAGMLHSDITGNLEPGNNWLMNQLQKILLTPSVESVPEWAACIRYAVTGKERSGTRAPFLRQKVLDCLCSPVPQSVGTSVLAKRYSFLSIALIEISPPKMSPAEEQYHVQILDELLDNMSHSSAQIFHFMIASLKSGRASVLLDLIIGFVYPVLSLQETSNKDLSLLAKSAFELLKWRILHRPFLENAIAAILSSVSDPNWRSRSALLSYLRTFTYSPRAALESKCWRGQGVLGRMGSSGVREHAAGVLASLMKGEDKDLSKDFRERSYAQAQRILDARRRNSKSGHSVATIHGAVLALTASVLSVPYDMPSWLPAHVTLLAGFIREPPPIRSTVTKAVAEFKRTHADTWITQKEAFTEDQLKVLRDTSSSSSYFA